jgi:microcin C transport system permease protein
MSPRALGITSVVFAALSAGQRLLGLHVPMLKVPFIAGAGLGWALLAILCVIGLWLALRGRRQWNFSPLTLKQFKRFRSIGRGWISFLILFGLALLAMLDNLIVGKQALIVRHEGQWSFPFLRRDVIPGKAYGLDYESETDYRALKKKFAKENKGDWVLMPPVPFASKQDSDQIIETLEKRADGKVYLPDEKEPFNGRAKTFFKDNPQQQRQEFTFRHGVLQGDMMGWDAKGEQIEKAMYEQGKRVSYTDFTNGQAAALESQAAPEMRTEIYPPSSPSIRQGHYLGTNSQGGDILAILFGGWQQALIASVLFLTFIFAVGITFGGILGYFGGIADLVGQRLIEIWSVLPILFVVMIVSALVEPTMVILVGIIAMFGWMRTATYLRTSTYREKARDYVASARLLGASTPRVLFKHVLPNTIAILVTLAPFEVAVIITSLAALDFLGFGLPPAEPSWGRLLDEGTQNFNYPWIVSSAFVAMVFVLVLVTFVGEAVREAFDPKKFTTYE